MSNNTEIKPENAKVVFEEILIADTPAEFIKTLDDMFDMYATIVFKEGGSDGNQVSHYRQLRRLLERIS